MTLEQEPIRNTRIEQFILQSRPAMPRILLILLPYPSYQIHTQPKSTQATFGNHVCVFLFSFFFSRICETCSYCLYTVHEQQLQSLTFLTFFSQSVHTVHCLWTHKFHFLAIFSLKMGPMILFTYLKIILLQYFLIFNFNFQLYPNELLNSSNKTTNPITSTQIAQPSHRPTQHPGLKPMPNFLTHPCPNPCLNLAKHLIF